MRKRMWLGLIAVGLLLSLSACSARTQFFPEETRKNGAHFATWQHVGYSAWRATPKETTKADIAAAQKEKWWGEVVLVEPIQ